MKNYLYIFILLFATAARADNVNALCFTAVGPTTSFIIKSENDVVNFEVTHHNGASYAPFWSSLVVPNDIEMLGKKADIIKKLGNGFKASFNTEKCKWSGEQKFSCVGSDERVNVNGLVVQPWALYSSVVHDSSFAGDYDYVDMTVSFIIDDETHNYTMRYQAGECELSQNPIAKRVSKSPQPISKK